MLGGVRVVALCIIFHDQTHKKQRLLFSTIRKDWWC